VRGKREEPRGTEKSIYVITVAVHSFLGQGGGLRAELQAQGGSRRRDIKRKERDTEGS